MLQFLLLIVYLTATVNSGEYDKLNRKCESLLMGQYKCDQPKIDTKTQQPINCTKSNEAQVSCRPAANITCDGRVFDGNTTGFYKSIPCKWTTQYNYKTAILLSVFLGFFGIDRFYLGYIAVGILKLCTFGFMLFGYVIDLILIITQTLGPADGSSYIVDYYDQITRISFSYNNNTYNHTY